MDAVAVSGTAAQPAKVDVIVLSGTAAQPQKIDLVVAKAATSPVVRVQKVDAEVHGTVTGAKPIRIAIEPVKAKPAKIVNY